MRAGQLRHRLQLQSATTAPDDFGQPIPTWSTYADVWGEVRPLTGRERYTAQQVQSSLSHQVRIRYRGGVAETHRVRWVDKATIKILDINAVLNTEQRDRELLLLCSEAAD